MEPQVREFSLDYMGIKVDPIGFLFEPNTQPHFGFWLSFYSIKLNGKVEPEI
jgi:hypothetical protein